MRKKFSKRFKGGLRSHARTLESFGIRAIQDTRHYFFSIIQWVRKESWRRYSAVVLVSLIVLTYPLLLFLNHQLLRSYRQLESVSILDREGAIVTLMQNKKGMYTQYGSELPPRAKELLIKKEDRFFYWHPGINPFSKARALFAYFLGGNRSGGSTITEQLVKNLLGNEHDRTISNKCIEMAYALALELFTSKDAILAMYANTVYMGNQVQGLDKAGELYFKKPLKNLDDTKLSMLLATISSPSAQNPWMLPNARASRNLAIRLGIAFDPKEAIVTPAHVYAPPQNFELSAMRVGCSLSCTTTLDAKLTEEIRAILRAHVDAAWGSGVRSGAVVVIKLPENELLAEVGTPNVHGSEDGQQINMALQARPIGSTIKPFIYLQGFARGLRPYTLVDDREYKFPIGNGFPLYPKNYDGTYRGWITLHAALSNSLNVPSVKVLQYIGLNNFYAFLERSLGFRPRQDLDEYQYGIALGALEMDPLTLAHFLTIFPQEGVLKPMRLFQSGTTTATVRAPMSDMLPEARVADPAYVALVTKVLNDRLTGVQQFGLTSTLNLPESNYAVKTGTSQDYHDSWTVGYTPDFLVVVWFGDPDNKPLRRITGQTGAGGVWRDVMELLMNSEYNSHTPLSLSLVRDVPIGSSLDIGLPGEAITDHRFLLPDNDLIISPQKDDTFLYEDHTTIPLAASESVSWHVGDTFLGSGQRILFSPSRADDYTITAQSRTGTKANVTIHVIVRP